MSEREMAMDVLSRAAWDCERCWKFANETAALEATNAAAEMELEAVWSVVSDAPYDYCTAHPSVAVQAEIGRLRGILRQIRELAARRCVVGLAEEALGISSGHAEGDATE